MLVVATLQLSASAHIHFFITNAGTTTVSISWTDGTFPSTPYGTVGDLNPGDTEEISFVNNGDSIYAPGNTEEEIYGNWNDNGHSGTISAGPAWGYNDGVEVVTSVYYSFDGTGLIVPPVYTNYTYTAANTLAVPAKATWTYNGAVVKTEILQPGQSDTWTTPAIETSPTAQSFTANISVTAMATGTGSTGLDDSGNPVLQFNNNGGTASTTQSGSGATITGGGGGGATVSAPATPASASGDSNIVTFTPSTGNPAQEPTLQGGITLAHQDAQSLLNGEKILNDSITAQTLTTTDLLGDILYWERTNNDVGWALVHALSNSLSGSGTNIFNGASNVFVLNEPTNLLSQIVSNTMARTNDYSAYETNKGLANFTAASNQMLSMIPNTATNSAAATAAATSAEGDYGITAFLSALNPSVPADASGIPTMTMDFCGRTIDLNPVDMFPNVANISYLGFKIVAELLFLLEIGRLFWQVVQTKAASQTGGVPDMDVWGEGELLGFGGGFGGNFIGVAVGLAVPTAFILIWSAAMAYIFSNLGVSISEAMNITAWSGQFSALSWALLTAFIPVNTLFTLLCTRITLQFTLAKIVSIAGNASRFLLGK